MSEKPNNSTLKATRLQPLRWLGVLLARLLGCRPAIRIKGESATLYPAMSRRQIRRVARAVCREARAAAK